MSHEAYQQPGPLFLKAPDWTRARLAAGALDAGYTPAEVDAAFRAADASLASNPPAQPHSPTSLAAAEDIKPHAVNLREAVYAAFSAAGGKGLTDEEGAHLLRMGPSTYRPRRVELLRAGRIRDSMTVRTVASGRRAAVWVVAQP